MDLKLYYKKIKEIAAGIEEEFAVVISKETADGGKDGLATEVAREMAARLIADGRARLASKQEAQEHRAAMQAAVTKASEESKNDKMQFAFLPEASLEALKASLLGKK